jgi:REP element-mobilizing transposase RayT
MTGPSSPPPPPGESRPPHNPGLCRLIQGKREWNYIPDTEARGLGFRGWHERGYLPHFDAPNVTQLVTFNLDDSFPVTRRAEWEPLLREPDESLRRRRLEAWLDRGCGECWLGQPAVAALVERALLAGHGHDYLLQAWVIMPNHVHLVVDVWRTPVSRMVKSWKGATGRAANSLIGRAGGFWQEDYWDTYIRDEKHLAQAIRYVDNNPTKSHLVPDPAAWRWGSARRRDVYGRLPEKLEMA